MITFTGLCLLGIAYTIQAVLRRLGLFDNTQHWTDWLVITLWLGGVGCWIYALGVVLVRYLP